MDLPTDRKASIEVYIRHGCGVRLILKCPVLFSADQCFDHNDKLEEPLGPIISAV